MKVQIKITKVFEFDSKSLGTREKDFLGDMFEASSFERHTQDEDQIKDAVLDTLDEVPDDLIDFTELKRGDYEVTVLDTDNPNEEPDETEEE